MNCQLKLEKIDKRKVWLDGFRPFDSMIIAELKKRYDVQFTYNSNAIEGNTLTQSETELVLTKGITVGGKTLDEHLAAGTNYRYPPHYLLAQFMGDFVSWLNQVASDGKE